MSPAGGGAGRRAAHPQSAIRRKAQRMLASHWQRVRSSFARHRTAFMLALVLAVAAGSTAYATYYVYRRAIAHRVALRMIAEMDVAIHDIETRASAIPPEDRLRYCVIAYTGCALRRDESMSAHWGYVPEKDLQAISERDRKLRDLVQNASDDLMRSVRPQTPASPHSPTDRTGTAGDADGPEER